MKMGKILSYVASLAVARPEPPVFTDDYGDHEYFGEGGVGSQVGAKTIVLLKGNGGSDGIYTTGGGDFSSGGGGFTSGGGGYTSGGEGYTSGSGGYTSGSGGYTSGGGGFGGHTGGGGTGGYNGFEQQSAIQKHIYVHLPPPEPEVSAPQQVIAPPPPKKHYKIVFIKAPTNPTQAAPVLPAPQQDQEKTLIYVLHKHPADSAPIVIPTAPPTPPSKPEVYFIRYKTQKEISPTHGPYGSTTLGPHYSSTFAPVSSTLGHPSTAVSIIPRPSPHPSYSTTANYH